MTTVHKVGVVGAGTMGARIALACVLGKRATAIFDILPGAAERAVQGVTGMIRETCADGRRRPRRQSRAGGCSRPRLRFKPA